MLNKIADYYYDGTLDAVICPSCIKQYEAENANYAALGETKSLRHREGAPLTCTCCNSKINSEYGELTV